MQVKYEGEDFAFDLDEIDVQQAKVIKTQFGLTLMGLERGLEEGDPDALMAVYWLMMAQNGRQASPQTMNFKIVKFAQAIGEAQIAEAEAAEKAERAEGKARRPAGPASRA